MDENELSNMIIGLAIEVHQTLGGPGLLESVYEEALAWELSNNKLIVQRQKKIPVVYKGQILTQPLMLDLVVNDLVIVECKSTTLVSEVYEAQLLTYLRLTGLKLGLLINFGVPYVSKGIKRVVNGL